MSQPRRGSDRTRAIVSGRRLEHRERSKAARRRAERFDHPNESEFDHGEYVDQYGRQYRVAYTNRIGGWAPGTPVPPRDMNDRASPGVVRLWVRLRRGLPNQWWYAATRDDASRMLTLRPLVAGRTAATVQVLSADRDGPRRRTGTVVARTEDYL